MLAPYLDEIEILLFDSARETDFPSPHAIAQMAKLAEKHAITFNVHLPTDITLGSGDDAIRQRAIEAVLGAFRLSIPLNPTAHIVHLPLDPPGMDQKSIAPWVQRLTKSVEALILGGIAGPSLCVETLDYPLKWISPVIDAFDLSVCIDIGHLLIHGMDWESEYRRWAERTTMIHLHGVEGQRDHRCLDALSAATLDRILRTLRSFTGIVSVEVFRFEDLEKSLICLEKCWQAIGSGHL